MADDDDLVQRFRQAISGADLDDLRGLVPRLLSLGSMDDPYPPRPDLRRAPLETTVTFRVRVDLDGARPPIWRRLDIRSDVTLDVVHQVLQAAFEWWDYHLHRFSLGGRAFDRESQLFLCPFDVDEGEDEGMPASEVRLDETMHQPGDVLHYVYDYGDDWQLTLRLEKVLPRDSDAPIAACVDGRRAAPPEDSRGLGEEALAEMRGDPAAFSADAVNQALNDPYFQLRDGGLDPDLVDLVNRLSATPFGDDLAARALMTLSPLPDPDDDLRRAHLAPVQWFLDRAHGDGIELTAAGYLKPADVVAACAVLPTIIEGIGKNNRENQTYQLLHFREELQRLSLLRKYKGRLLLTKAGDAARADLGALWSHLADRLVPDERDRFAREAGLLVLLHAASARGEAIPIDQIAAMLGELGWRFDGQTAVRGYDLWHTRGNVFTLLENIDEVRRDSWGRDRPIGPVAAALARDALRGRPAV